jgi:hypothetical protein
MKNRLLTVCATAIVVMALLSSMWVLPVVTPATASSNLPDHTESAARLTGPVVAPTPTSKQLARFDEVAGVFSVRYPRDFSRIVRLDTVSDLYGYAFSNDDASATLAVGFLVMSATDMSDDEWSLIFSVLSPEMLIRMLGPGFADTYEEIAREEAEAGAHALYWEGKAAEEGRQCGMRLEESEGVLAIIALTAASDRWVEREEVFAQSLASLEWSPVLVREQSTLGESPETEGGETPVADEDDIPAPPGDEDIPEAGVLPEDEPTGDDVDTLNLDDFLAATPTAEIEEPAEDTDVIQSDETVVSPHEAVAFEDPNGVFTMSYPAEFEDSEAPSIDGDNYVFVAYTTDGSSYIGASFTVLADAALSNAEWRAALNAMVEAALGNVGEDAVEVYRTAGKPGQHWIYLEGVSEDNAAHAFYYLEEAEGVLAIMLGRVPSDEWADRESALLDAVSSFLWSPAAAREVLEAAVQPEPEPEPVPTPTQRPRPTESPAADPGIPAGKGGLVMLNCRSDVVTVDIIPDAIFQELAPKQGEQCFRGAPIFLNPGDHILKAAIAGMPSQGEATVTIVAGEWLEFTWY